MRIVADHASASAAGGSPLAMRHFGDMSRAEIAAQLGVSPTRICRLLIRTLTQLRTGVLAAQPTRATRLHRGRHG
jgi:hypothetical protein